MSSTDLKSCPFCGSHQVTMSTGWASDSVVWVAICKACSASVSHEDEESAAKAWNTRARTPETAPGQSADLIADIEHLTNAGFGICRTQAIDLITALRAAEAENARLRETNALTAQLAERERRIEELDAECFRLAAHVCEYRSGDDHGNPLCLMVNKRIPRDMTVTRPLTKEPDEDTLSKLKGG